MAVTSGGIIVYCVVCVMIAANNSCAVLSAVDGGVLVVTDVRDVKLICTAAATIGIVANMVTTHVLSTMIVIENRV